MSFPIFAMGASVKPDSPLCANPDYLNVYPMVLADNSNGNIYCSIKSADSSIASMETPFVVGQDTNRGQYQTDYHNTLDGTSAYYFCPETSATPCTQATPGSGIDAYLTSAFKVSGSDIYCAGTTQIAVDASYQSLSFYIEDVTDSSNNITLDVDVFVSTDHPTSATINKTQVVNYTAWFYNYTDGIKTFTDVGATAGTSVWYTDTDFWVYVRLRLLSAGTGKIKGIRLSETRVDLKFQ